MKKHRMTTKALSVLLTVIMLFSTISVGIIVPEAGLTASAAEETVNVKDLDELRAAVTTASTNGSGKKTIIKLTANISSTTAQKTLGTFSNAANAVLDLAGHTLSFEYRASSDYTGDQTFVQLPSENAGTKYIGKDTLSTAMINVESGSTLQIINSTGSGTISVKTEINDDADNTGGTTHQTSSSVIKSAGTLIIGDPSKGPDATENKITIVAESAVRNTDDSGAILAWELCDKGGSVHAMAITLTGSSVFKMYGGTIKAAGLVRTHRNGTYNHRVYGINIEGCQSAEIYGGSVNIPLYSFTNDAYTIAGSTSTAGNPGDSRISAIRCNTNNLFIFDLDSNVKAKASKNTGQDTDVHVSNIYCPSADNTTYAVNVYGGNFSYNLETETGTSTADLLANCISGAYAIAANKSLSYTSSSQVNKEPGSATGDDGEQSESCKFQTLLVHGGANSFNGLNFFDSRKYPTFKDYKSAVESASAAIDAYGITLTDTPSGTKDNEDSLTCTTYNYKRNGYNQIGWTGKTHPGTAAVTKYNSTSAAEINKNGGTLFLEPVWEKNTYKITYDFGDGDGQYYPVDAELKNDYITKHDEYNIEDQKFIPVPERPGHSFAGWRVIHGAIRTEDDNSIGWETNVLYGWDISENKANELNTQGHYGDITLVATWTPNVYDAEISYFTANAEKFRYQSFIPGEGKELVSTNLSGQAIHVADKFNIAPTKTEHHIFLGYYEAKAKDGSPSNWNGGRVNVLDEDGKVLSDENIANQFAGKYGDVVFTPAFKAKEYTIKYYSAENPPALLATETYTIDDSNAELDLKVLDNSGFVFGGWELRFAPNSSWQKNSPEDPYTAFPKGAYGDIELYAVCDYDAAGLTIEFYDEDGTTRLGEGKYSGLLGYSGRIESARPGYYISGWTVMNPKPGVEGGWTDEDVTVVNGVTTLAKKKTESVKLKAKYTAKTYTITFRTNDSSIPAPAPITYTVAGEFELPVISKTAYDTPRWKLSSDEAEGNWKYFDADGKTVTYLGKYNMASSAEKLYGNVELTADWKATEYTVSFNTAGGKFTDASGLKETDIFRTNVGLDLRDYRNPNNIKRNGYTFIGWDIDIENYDETGWKGFREQIGDNKVTALPANKGYYGNITLIARWEAETYTIRFSFPEGVTPERPVDPITYTPDDAVIALPSAEEALVVGHTMKGWKLDVSKDGWLAYDYGFVVDSEDPGHGERWGDITLLADVSPTEYKITYVDSEGNPLENKTEAYHITDAVELYDYKKPGYTTNGWYVYNEGINTGSWRTEYCYELGVTHSGMFGNVKLYPDVKINEYTVTLVDTNGAVLGEFSYNVEYKGTLPSDFTKTGQVLRGWQVKKVDAADCSWILHSFVNVTDEISDSYGNVTLEAVWGVRTHTVTWQDDAGNEISHESVNYGTVPEYKGETPTKDPDDGISYEFVGWTPEPQPVTADVQYKAVFRPVYNVYTITWKDADGTPLLTTRVKHGEHPVCNTPPSAAEGKYFAGWKDENGNILDSNTVAVGDMTFTAQYADLSGTVITWNVPWGDEMKVFKTVWEGSGEPVWPYSDYLYTQNGYAYTINGWIPSGNNVYSAAVAANAISYTAVFDPQGGIFTESKVVSYNAQYGLKMPQPVKPGYRFTGWKAVPSGDGTWVSDATYSETAYSGAWGDVSFTATWIIETYKLTIRTDAGEEIQNYTVQSDKELPLLSKPGYIHTGWLVYSADNSNWNMGEIMDVNQKLLGVYGNIKVEPVWTAKTYKIHWISGDTTVTVEVKFGEAIEAQAPIARPGYTAKWIEEIPSVMTTPSDITFNADYSAIKYYLKYNVNGGDAINGTEYYITSAGALATPAKVGSTFKGWKVTLSNGSWEQGKVYDADTALAGNYGDVTLTAVWEINSYDITWIVGDEITVTSWYFGTRPSYGGTPSKPSSDKVSYEFTGKWLAENDQKYNSSAIPLVTGNATYTADFVEVNRRYVITWNIEGVETNQIYRYGDLVICPFVGENAPSKPSTADSDFIFAGWTPEITHVTGDITYTAIFEKHVRLQGITLSKTAVYITVDETETISAILQPSLATSKDVEWVSGNVNIATVDENGKIYGVSAGETTVCAQSKDGRLKAFCLVNVSPVLAQYIVVSAAGVPTTRLPGEKVQLYATIMPENASTKVISWTTSDPEVATVSTGGLVTFGMKVGSATITATADGYATGSITVTTTTKAEAGEKENTYVVMFTQSSSSYIIAGQTFDSISIVVEEGESIEFLLTEPHFVTLNGREFERDTDGVYRIRDIRENITIFATERPDTGVEEPEEPDDSGNKLSFFDKLKAFFRSIVEFFRNLFS